MSGIVLGVAALLLVVAAGVQWFRAAFGVCLPSNRSRYVAAWLGGVVLAGASWTQAPGWIGGIAATLALLGGGFFLFTVAISRQVATSDAITVGSTLPEFSAPDEDGGIFHSATLAGHPVLLKFFRGHW